MRLLDILAGFLLMALCVALCLLLLPFYLPGELMRDWAECGETEDCA